MSSIESVVARRSPYTAGPVRRLRRFARPLGLAHAGFGLGFERLLVYVCGLSNIRDALPYPRAPGQAEY